MHRFFILNFNPFLSPKKKKKKNSIHFIAKYKSLKISSLFIQKKKSRSFNYLFIYFFFERDEHFG